jgi:uncharacterized protein with HEPN domain
VKDDRVYLKHILRCIDRIEEYTAQGSLFSNHLIQDAVIRNLQTLSESTQRLSSSAKSTRTDIDWNAISGFRNVLVHDYLGVDIKYISRTVTSDIPALKAACEDLLSRLGD